MMSMPTMICPVDRTDEFVTALAAHHKVAVEKARPLSPRSTPHEFTQLAVEIVGRIDEMRGFIDKCSRRYHDYSLRGMRDAERDEIDSAVAQFLRTAVSQIDELKFDAVAQLEAEKGAFPAHKLGVVAILNEELQAVGKLSEELRSARIRHAIAEKAKVKVTYTAEVARKFAEERRTERGEEEEEDFGMLEQEFERENASLVSELVQTREQVREAEKTVFEIASLNHLFATKVLEQAKEIETLYDLAVEATTYVDRGNRELRKMKQRGPVVKYALAFLAVVLAFALLFLEWMNKRRAFFFV